MKSNLKLILILDYKMTNDTDKCKCYTPEAINQIKLMYIIAIILWVIIIYVFHIHETDIIGWIFIIIPIIVYSINFINIDFCSTDVEGEMFSGNFLLFTVIILTILTNSGKDENKKEIYRIIFLAVIISTLSLIDIWVPKDKIIIVKHFRTILITAALTLLAYGLYKYYQYI